MTPVLPDDLADTRRAGNRTGATPSGCIHVSHGRKGVEEYASKQ